MAVDTSKWLPMVFGFFLPLLLFFMVFVFLVVYRRINRKVSTNKSSFLCMIDHKLVVKFIIKILYDLGFVF